MAWNPIKGSAETKRLSQTSAPGISYNALRQDTQPLLEIVEVIAFSSRLLEMSALKQHLSYERTRRTAENPVSKYYDHDYYNY